MSLRIAWVSSELTPFAKTGGLGDVSAALASFLHRDGHDIRVFLPLYATLRGVERSQLRPVGFVHQVPIPVGDADLSFSLYSTPLPGTDLPIYLIHCPALYDRDGFYCQDGDEDLRFAYLTQAALVACQHMGFAPHILHTNDWHTALAPVYLRTRFAWDRLFHSTRTVHTIHNLGYQGVFSADVLDRIGLGERAALFHQEDLAAGRVNFLKTGLLYADVLTTVSPTYAAEIQTPEHGVGLDPLLRARRERLVGILNGIDTAEWSPDSDRYLPAPYSASNLEGKATCRDELLRSFGLSHPDPGIPVVGLVSRLTSQKGIDLLIEVLPRFLASERMSLVVVGTGERRYEDFFHHLQASFRDRMCFYRGYSEEAAHLVEAGADIFLMPSLYEPCGLNQMYSLRYGTVPIVRKTGGLADTVELYDPRDDSGTGFVFEHYTTTGLAWALDAALGLFHDDPAAWRRLMQRGMARDDSWDRRGRLYVELYERLAGR